MTFFFYTVMQQSILLILSFNKICKLFSQLFIEMDNFAC